MRAESLREHGYSVVVYHSPFAVTRCDLYVHSVTLDRPSEEHFGAQENGSAHIDTIAPRYFVQTSPRAGMGEHIVRKTRPICRRISPKKWQPRFNWRSTRDFTPFVDRLLKIEVNCRRGWRSTGGASSKCTARGRTESRSRCVRRLLLHCDQESRPTKSSVAPA